jgi:inner membrane transporter RhtA
MTPFKPSTWHGNKVPGRRAWNPIWRRPARLRRAWRAADRKLIAAWGAVLAVMNNCFYLAIERLPPGTVAAIEFLPVIALAAVAARTARNALALALLPATATVVGIVVLTQIPAPAEAHGVALVVVGVAAHRARSRTRPSAEVDALREG